MSKKSVPILLLFLSLFIFNSCSLKSAHPTFKGLEETNTLQIWSEHQGSLSAEKLITDRDKIETVINFIEKINYKLYEKKDKAKFENDGYWQFRIKFDDRNKEIYLYKNFAEIGHMRYVIKDDVHNEFFRIYENI